MAKPATAAPSDLVIDTKLRNQYLSCLLLGSWFANPPLDGGGSQSSAEKTISVFHQRLPETWKFRDYAERHIHSPYLSCHESSRKLLISSQHSHAVFGAVHDPAADAVAATPQRKMLLTFCSCGNQLGLFNVVTSSVMLFKWQVDCQTAVISKPPSSLDCLAAMLLTSLSRHGAAKSVIVPASHWERTTENQGYGLGNRALSNQVLHVWILNNRIQYSSTQTGIGGTKTAIKLLYRPISCAEGEKMVESLASNVHEVNLPKEAVSDAWEGLQRSNDLLPPGERLFQNFSVGLLDRWEVA